MERVVWLLLYPGWHRVGFLVKRSSRFAPFLLSLHIYPITPKNQPTNQCCQPTIFTVGIVSFLFICFSLCADADG